MYVIEWTIIESLSVPDSNFFEVPCSIQKVVKFKGRINVQLPHVDVMAFSVHQLHRRALLQGRTDTALAISPTTLHCEET